VSMTTGTRERRAIRHALHSLDRQPPLEADVSFLARLRLARDDGHKQNAFPDLAADPLIPGVSSTQFVLVEPVLDPGGAKRIGNATCGVAVLRCVTQEYATGVFRAPSLFELPRLGTRIGMHHPRCAS
jgi:hypothetical protein